MTTFSYPEGNLYVWTGLANASGNGLMFVQNVRVSLEMQWDTRASLSGTYRDHLIGRVANLSFGRTHAISAILPAWHLSGTAVHMKFMAANYAGSAGYICYSGRLDKVELAGAWGGAFEYQVAAHANIWSVF